MGFFRQAYWSGLPFPPPGDFPNPGIELEPPAAPALQVDSLLLSHCGSPLNCLMIHNRNRSGEGSRLHGVRRYVLFYKKKKIRVWEKSVAAKAGPPRLVPKAGALSDGPLEVTDHETRP